MFGFRNQRENTRMAEIVQSRLEAITRESELAARAHGRADVASASEDDARSEYEQVVQEAGDAPISEGSLVALHR